MIIVDWASITKTEEIPFMGDELTAHLKARRGETRYASCSAWTLLRNVLQNNGFSSGIVAFTKTGKPFFVDNPVFFSLSHTKGLCAAAISDCPVGVDIEWCRDSYSPRLIEKSLTETERVSYDGDFTRIWCRKEAMVKMTGKGISGYPNSIDTTVPHFWEQKIESNGRQFWIVAVNDKSV